MHIGLFIPCFIDAFRKSGSQRSSSWNGSVTRSYTRATRPAADNQWPIRFNVEAADTEALFVRNFSGFDYMVAPSGSCVHHVRDNFDAIEQTPEVKEVRARTYELVEFMHDIQKLEAFPWARFPHR